MGVGGRVGGKGMFAATSGYISASLTSYRAPGHSDEVRTKEAKRLLCTNSVVYISQVEHWTIFMLNTATTTVVQTIQYSAVHHSAVYRRSRSPIDHERSPW